MSPARITFSSSASSAAFPSPQVRTVEGPDLGYWKNRPTGMDSVGALAQAAQDLYVTFVSFGCCSRLMT